MNVSDAAFRLETQITLPADEVHLWRVDLANVAKGEQKWEQILSADERARAARFRFSRDRQYFTATRALLRTILGGYLDSDRIVPPSWKGKIATAISFYRNVLARGIPV